MLDTFPSGDLSTRWNILRCYAPSLLRSIFESPLDHTFYGGTIPAEIKDGRSDRSGIHSWIQAGIAGRDVLIDYAGIKYSTFDCHEIKLSAILEIAKECQITFEKGDILFIRAGMTREWCGLAWALSTAVLAASYKLTHTGMDTMECVTILVGVWICGRSM